MRWIKMGAWRSCISGCPLTSRMAAMPLNFGLGLPSQSPSMSKEPPSWGAPPVVGGQPLQKSEPDLRIPQLYACPQILTPSLTVTGVRMAHNFRADEARRATAMDAEKGRTPAGPSSAPYNPRPHPQSKVRALTNVPEQIR